MDIDTLTRRALSARAPRYTSYPPATQFTDAVQAPDAACWLAGIREGARVSLYVHIPFCRRLCHFCACRTQGTTTGAPLAAYVEDLEREMDLVAAALPPGVRIGHLHLGGGTPTILPPDLLRRVFAAVDARWPRAEHAEISAELDPTEIDEARLDALAGAGLTRASLGVQDFAPLVQAAIGRAQSYEQTRAAVVGLRARGVAGINFDLLYGLPLQTQASLRRTLLRMARLSPDRIALYGYAHVPWVARRQRLIREADLPIPAERLVLQRMASRWLRTQGWRAVGIDHFAKPDDAMARTAEDGALRRNFQGYTCDPEEVLIGIGASSVSRLPGGYTQNAAHTGQWAARVRGGLLPTVRGHAFRGEDALRGALIERLLCDFALDPARSADPVRARALIAPLRAAWAEALEPDAPEGGLRLRRGFGHLARLMAQDLDAYATPEGRHSAAV
ncbi:oxygen-independent coproporphyrinogen III oxidase [Jannaschia sp. Os4]|uniref:oxygen-independent coproporphyrinogen III oxidase n=1 Tax=Jannaschia sp. Os4 TaxID=2807617 RepID=UPI001939A701|nr:oxygen-independent coproporphyrinogen III oxidase [Jannaschia sp. Os4]MBM2576460.1 oxygen-independent coproporphyrinogen III oxidase [Jannaschia sp. Os4]